MRRHFILVPVLGLTLAVVAAVLWVGSRVALFGPTADGASDGATRGNPQSNRTRVLVTADDPARGATDALVTLVSFCDFRTPACKRTARTLFEAVLAYPHGVRVVFKALPSKDDPASMLAAKGALAAHGQGRFWEMHDLLFMEPGTFDRAVLEEKAKMLGLDVAMFRARLDSPEVETSIAADIADAERLGVHAAPALFLNGLAINDGALPFVDLKPRIERELQQVRGMAKERGLDADEVYGAMMREARTEPIAK